MRSGNINIRISLVRGGGTKPILELLEPRLLLDGVPAAPAFELFDAANAIFAENQGQWSDESIRYAFDGNGANVLFTDTGPVFQLFGNEGPAGQFSAQFDGANNVSPVGLEQSQSVFNYHLGDQSAWRDGVATYASVAYMGLYAGIDLQTWGRRDHLKYEFRVSPGSDFSQISISYSGIDSLAIDDAGALHVALPGGLGEVVDNTPYIYQIIDGVEVHVAGAYRLVDADTYTFEITGSYDPTAELVIDPELDWSTYLGGNSGDRAYSIATDSGGASLVAGYTWSRGLSGGWDESFNGGGDAFAAKFSATGEHLWSTYLGGNSGDYGYGIAVDASDNVLVTGRTQSSGWVSGGWLADFDGSSDGFVVKLNASGGHVWSSYLGGSSWDEGHAIAADAGGGVLVTGSTESSGWITGGWKTSYSGRRDAFAVKLSAAGEHVWSSYLGGDKDDRSYGIAADASGNALVTGYTYSSGWTSGGWSDSHAGGGGDGFVVKLSGDVGGHIWSSYLGGSSSDYGYGIAVDSGGYALVTGYTNSSGWISGGWNTEPGGLGDGFVVKLDAAGEHIWSSYLGGSSIDHAYGVASDAGGNALVTGYTGSDDWISSGLDTSYGGAYDGFVVKLSAAGGHLWSTYLGGSGDDRAHGIAIDASGNALVTGETESSGWVADGDDTTHNGFADAFAAKLTGVVTFTDSGLEQALRDATNTPFGYITDDDLEPLTSLDASTRSIANLEGLQNCTNLTDLNLSGNQFVDLQALIDSGVLSSGDTVNLTGNPLSSLACIVQIPALEERGITVEYTIPLGAISEVLERYIYYNNSASDSGGPIANLNDDDAIDLDINPLLSGGVPGRANYTNYWRGINGILVDIDRLFSAPTSGDFRIRITETANPVTWSPGPEPTVTVQPGEGLGGSDRVTLTWADGAIINQWVEITVMPDVIGGFGQVGNSVFYFGNAVGDTDGDGQVDHSDYGVLQDQLGGSGDDLTADFDRNGRVDLNDFTILRGSYGNIIATPPILTGDADGNGVVGYGDYEILTTQFGRTGRGLRTDFDGNGMVNLLDFAILRSNFGNVLAEHETPLAAPTSTLLTNIQPIAILAAPLVPIAIHPSYDIDDANMNNDSITAAEPQLTFDLLGAPPSVNGYIPEPTPISTGVTTPAYYRTATAEYDLRPLEKDPPTDSETGDLLTDILAKSPLAPPL